MITATVVGFRVSIGVRVFVQTDGRSASEATKTIQDEIETLGCVWAAYRDVCKGLNS